MARKPMKSVYERINIVQNKIAQLENELKELKSQLITLNKERDSLEMNQLFQYARENDLTIDEVINAINMFSIKNKKRVD